VKSFTFGVRSIRRVNYSCLLCLPLSWVRHSGLMDNGKVSVTMSETGDLVLAAVPNTGTDVPQKTRDYRDQNVRSPTFAVPSHGPSREAS
jgi:hypothetical protein